MVTSSGHVSRRTLQAVAFLLLAAPSLRCQVPPDFEGERRISGFAAELSGEGDAERGELKVALGGLAGRIALDEQLAELERRERTEAPRRAFESIVARHFVKGGSGYRLSDDREGLEAWIGNRCRQREADMRVVASAIAAVRKGLAGDGALDDTLRAFLAREDATALIYSEMLRPRLRPDRMAQTLAWVLVPGDDGRRSVPARFAGRAERARARHRVLFGATADLREEFARLASELDPREPLRDRLAALLREELFAIESVSNAAAREENPGGAGITRDILLRWEAALPRGAGGRRVLEARRASIAGAIEGFALRRWDLVMLAATAQRVASELAPGAANDDWREILGANTAPLLVSRPRKAAKPDARKTLWERTPFGRTLVAGASGAFRIHRHFRYETEQWIGELRDSATERAPLEDAITAFAAKLADDNLRTVISSPAGRDLLGQWARHVAVPEDRDVLDLWIQKSFAGTPPGLTPEGREACRRLVERARTIEVELTAAGTATDLSLRKLDLRGEGLELLRSSAFYNPRTAAGAYYYDAYFPDHFAARLFGSFGWDLRSSKSETEYLERVLKRMPALERLSRSHRKLILRFAGTPPWLSSSNDPGSFEPKGGYKNKSTHPPRDYAVWARMVRETARECRALPVERYYEIWNEPDGMYWQSGMKELIELYARTARTIREVDPEAKVGGLAVNQWDRGLKRDPEAGPITLALIRAAGEQGFPLDFISWHHFGRPISAIQEAKGTYLAECRRVGLAKMPELLITEWSTPGRGSPFAAPLLGRMLLGFWEAGVDVQTIAAWEEFHAEPDFRGYAPWGIITQQGARKNTWHVHRYFDRLSRNSQGAAVVPIDEQRTLVLSRKPEHTWELVILNMASPSRYTAALATLRGAGVENRELAAYQTQEELARAIAAGQSRDARHAAAFRAAQRVWKEHPVPTDRLHLVIEGAQRLEVLEAESVRMSNGAKRVITLGNILSCDLAGQEVVRLLLRVR